MSPAPRIASLLPATTELVCALGLEDALVGVSHECDHPPSVRARRALTSTRVVARGGSAEVDRDVRRLVERALAVYAVDVDALRETAPDVVLTQDLCAVCAVSLDDVRAALAEVGLARTRVVSVAPLDLEGVLASFATVAAALGVESAGERLIASLRARIEAVRVRSARLARRAVLTIEWIEPTMVGGTWMPELVELAGGRALAARAGERAPTLGRAELAALAPDVVVVKPCGFDLERTRAESAALARLLDGLRWPALERGEVWLADGNAFFNRPGPRIVESLEILAACVHPTEFGDLARRHAGAFESLGTASDP